MSTNRSCLLKNVCFSHSNRGKIDLLNDESKAKFIENFTIRPGYTKFYRFLV